jgi:hypothetical protein
MEKIKIQLFCATLITFISLQGLLPKASISQIPNINVSGGFSIDLPEPIAAIFRKFDEIVGNVETFLSDLGIEVSRGDIGLPDIEEAYKLFEENNQIDIALDVFGSQTGSTVSIKDKLLQQYLKDLGHEYSNNSALSIEGQEKIVEQIESAKKTVEASSELANDSNSEDVSQNILRNISNQAALNQQLDNMILFELQEDKISRALSVSIQGESLAELAKQTARDEREATSLYKASLYNYGLVSIPGQHLISQ